MKFIPYNKLDHNISSISYILLPPKIDLWYDQCFDEIWDTNLQTVIGVLLKKNT